MSIDVPLWLSIVLMIGALASTVGAGVAIARSSAARASVEVLTLINSELRADNAELRQTLRDEETKRVEDKAQCDAQIAELRGEMKAMTNSLTEGIGVQIGAHVGEEVVKMIKEASSSGDVIVPVRSTKADG